MCDGGEWTRVTVGCVVKRAQGQLTDLFTVRCAADWCAQEEWSSLVQRLDVAYHSTVFPVCPSCLLCCIIPFCCAVCFFDSRRSSKVALVVAQENARLELLGLEWLRTPIRDAQQRTLMVLKWTATRPAFEAANPQCRAVSREPVPVDFLSREMQMQLTIAAASPEMVAAQGREAAAKLGWTAPPLGQPQPQPQLSQPPPQRQSMEMAAAPPHGSAQPVAPQPAPGHGQSSDPPPPVYSQPPPAYGAPPVQPQQQQQPQQPQQQPQPVVFVQPAYGQTAYGSSVYGQPAVFVQQQQAGPVFVVQVQPQGTGR